MATFLEKTKKTIAEGSIDVKLLVDRLQKTTEGDTVTYDELSELIGRNIQVNRHLLQSARKSLRRNEGILFDCIHSTGLRRMNNSDIVCKVTTQPFKRIRSTIRNAGKDMTCIDDQLLSNPERITVNATRSLFGVLHQFTLPKAIENIKAASDEALPIGKTLAIFQRTSDNA